MTRSRYDVPEPYCSRPFRVSDALKAGLPKDVLYGAQFWSPFVGVRIPCTVPDSLQVRCQAASLLVPSDAAFSHRTAAGLCDLPIPEIRQQTGISLLKKKSDIIEDVPQRAGSDPSELPNTGTPAWQAIDIMVRPDQVVPQIAGMRGHTGLREDPSDVAVVDGLRVVHPERTFFHLAETLSLDDLVVLGDAIVRKWSQLDRLVGRAAGLRRRRGIVRARQALTLVHPGVDSPPETRVRLLLVRAGLPCPLVNVDVYDEAGGWLARPDLSYPHLKIAIEYDGDHHRTDKRQWRRDRARDENLRHAGWIVITLTADDVFRHPDRLVARVTHYWRRRTSAAQIAA